MSPVNPTSLLAQHALPQDLLSLSRDTLRDPGYINRVIDRVLMPVADAATGATGATGATQPGLFSFLHALDALSPLLKLHTDILAGQTMGATGHAGPGAIPMSPAALSGIEGPFDEPQPSLVDLVKLTDQVLVRAGLPEQTLYLGDYLPAEALRARSEGLRVNRAPKVYLASKTFYAPVWRWLRGGGNRALFEVSSSWHWMPAVLDARYYRELWASCVDEAADADMVILVARPGDTLRGALIEAGAALGRDKPVYQIGTCASLQAGERSDASFTGHALWRFAEDPWEAAQSYRAEFQS